MCGSGQRRDSVGRRPGSPMAGGWSAPATDVTERPSGDPVATDSGHKPSDTARAELRASDFERDAVADALRRHAAAGRLEVDELDERVARALGARTRADLTIQLADLPELPPELSTSALAKTSAPPEWRGYLTVMALLVAIWVLTGAGHPWPLYPALGWGLPLLLSSRAAGTPRPSSATTG